MLNNAKALVVVLTLALLTFALCKPIALEFMREETFKRRRNVWLFVTGLAFLSPNFWIFAVPAFVLLVWAARQDANPLSLFCLLLFAVPHASVYIPVPLINNLFALTPHRLLILAILIPACLARRDSSGSRFPWTAAHVCLVAFLALQVVLLVPYETLTNTLRRTFLLIIDVAVVFFAFSRIDVREKVADILASSWLGVALLCPIAIFESIRGWLLYTGIPSMWGDPNTLAWLFRSDQLRAQAAAGHSITLGYLIALALAFYLYLRLRARPSKTVDALIAIVMSAALIVTFSRAAWLTAVLAAAIFALTRPNAVRHLASTALVCAVGMGVMLVTPLKEKVLDRLPFIGTAEQETVEYRQQLADTSWTLVNQHPLFGDPFVTLKMESLRQGQGIIDIINGYLYIALFNGYTGLALFCGVLLFSTARIWKAWRKAPREDWDDRARHAAVIASLVATAFFIAAASYGLTTYLLCGLAISAAATRARLRAFHSPMAPSPPDLARPSTT